MHLKRSWPAVSHLKHSEREREELCFSSSGSVCLWYSDILTAVNWREHQAPQNAPSQNPPQWLLCSSYQTHPYGTSQEQENSDNIYIRAATNSRYYYYEWISHWSIIFIHHFVCKIIIYLTWWMKYSMTGEKNTSYFCNIMSGDLMTLSISLSYIISVI